MVAKWPFGGRQISTPVQLFILCVAVLIPALAFAGVLTWRYSESERQNVYDQALDDARQISNTLDRDLGGRIAAMRILGLSLSLGSRDWPAFHGQLLRAKAILGADIAFKSADGEIPADTSQAAGATRQEPLSASEASAIAQQRPAISNLIDANAEAERPYLTISVPVRAEQGPHGVLTMRVESARLVDILLQSGMPGEWTIVMVDAAGRLIARSRDPDRFIGRTATQSLLDNTTRRFGTWLGITLEGERVLSGYSASDLAPWRVAVGVPVSTVDGPLNASLLGMLLLGMMGLLISACVAVFFGGAISGAMGQLARQAANPERADMVPAPTTPLREVNTVSAALVEAAGHLRRQASERNEAERALKDSRANMERVLQTAPIGIVEINPKGISFANATARDLLRLTINEDSSYSLPQWELRRVTGEILPPGESPSAKALRGEVLAGEEVALVDPATGERRVVSINTTPIIEDGRFAGSLATFVDISGRYTAEQALREQTHRLETLNKTGAQIAAQLDLESLIQSVTDAGVELTGAHFGAFFYNTVNERGEILTLYTISGVDREHFSKFPMPRNTKVFSPTFKGEGVVRSEDILLDPRYGHNSPHSGMPEGHLPVRSYLAVPVKSRSGEVIGGLFFGHPEPGVFQERHEHLLLGIAAQSAIAIDNARLYENAQRAEAAVRAFNETLEAQIAARTHELSEANERLRTEIAQRETVEDQLRQAQKMEAVGQLTGGLAHDFNNLLAIVIGSLDVLSRRLERGQTEDLKRFIGAATDGANRAAALTQRLLAFSRRQPLAPVPIKANQLVSDMVDLLSSTIKSGVQVETKLDPETWTTHADVNQLENALLNLAVNARDAMPDGGVLTLSTSNTMLGAAYCAKHPGVTPGEYVLVAVSDTGTGMPPEVIERAFDPFFTTKGPGKGTGLGLSQIYGFVQQTGGHIAIESAVGQGTTIKMYLPRHAEKKPTRAKPRKPRASAPDKAAP